MLVDRNSAGRWLVGGVVGVSVYKISSNRNLHLFGQKSGPFSRT